MDEEDARSHPFPDALHDLYAGLAGLSVEETQTLPSEYVSDRVTAWSVWHAAEQMQQMRMLAAFLGVKLR